MKEAHRAVSPKGLYNARDFAVSRPNVRKARLRGAPHSRLRAKIFAQSIEAVRMMLRNATMSQSEVARSEAKKTRVSTFRAHARAAFSLMLQCWRLVVRGRYRWDRRGVHLFLLVGKRNRTAPARLLENLLRPAHRMNVEAVLDLVGDFRQILDVFLRDQHCLDAPA